MRVQLQIDGAPQRAADHARELAGLGADGVFTFEGPHDVFLPLVAAAGAASVDLMTNVAIAGPRSPLHLAHAAYDLQVYSGGRFRLGLGSQIKVHIEKRYGAQWAKPAEKMAETVTAIKARASSDSAFSGTLPRIQRTAISARNAPVITICSEASIFDCNAPCQSASSAMG